MPSFYFLILELINAVTLQWRQISHVFISLHGHFPSGVIMIEKGIYKSVIGILTLAAKMIFLEFEVFHHQIPFLRGWNVSDNGQE